MDIIFIPFVLTAAYRMAESKEDQNQMHSAIKTSLWN